MLDSTERQKISSSVLLFPPRVPTSPRKVLSHGLACHICQLSNNEMRQGIFWFLRLTSAGALLLKYLVILGGQMLAFYYDAIADNA